MTREEYTNGGTYLVCKRGTALPHARLTEQDVHWIRANREGLTMREQARQLNVHWRTVEKVRYYETWRHVA